MPQYQGVWTLPVAARLQSNQQWATDPLFENTTLLLQADNAANGAQNNTFLDSSSNNFTITRNGNTTQGTFTPYSLQPGAWGNYFNGTGNYLRAPSSSAFNFGTGDFTIEAWVLDAGSSLGPQIYDAGLSNSAGSLWFGWYTDILYFRIDGTANDITYAYGIPKVWTHVAATRQSGTVRIFINGIQVASGTRNQNVTQQEPYIGYGAGTNSLGYTSNMRVVKGTAVYTSNFTPSPIPLTAIANTSLLTCQSNRFVDNSTNNFALTITGTPSVQAFSPFAPQYQWTAPVIGGSGYFDGSGDYLSIADNTAFQFGSGDFTIEAWVYRTATSGGAQQIIGSHEDGLAASFLLYISSANKLTMAVNNSIQAVSAGSVPVSAWTHVAGVRNGNTIFVYVNGIQDGSVAFSTSVNSNAYPITIAADQNGDESFYSGYIANLRIVKGTAVYTSNFTPPTAPLTNITNTSLLCNFTNAGIYDGTMKNNLETVGNAQVSTSVVKYGTGSMAFDGTGDYLVTPSSPVNILGSGDFTIEFWAYPSNTSAAYRALVASENYAGTTGGWSIYQNGTSIEVWLTAGQVINATSALTAATWQHVALSRASGTVRLFVNGTSIASASNTAEWTGQKIFIGDNNYAGSDYFYNGYLDDLRITKGVARYTANFIPPSVALPRQ